MMDKIYISDNIYYQNYDGTGGRIPPVWLYQVMSEGSAEGSIIPGDTDLPTNQVILVYEEV